MMKLSVIKENKLAIQNNYQKKYRTPNKEILSNLAMTPQLSFAQARVLKANKLGFTGAKEKTDLPADLQELNAIADLLEKGADARLIQIAREARMRHYRGLDNAINSKEFGKPVLSPETEWEFGTNCIEEGEKLRNKLKTPGINVPANKNTAMFINYILYKMLLKKLDKELGGKVQSITDIENPNKKIKIGNDLTIESFEKNPETREILAKTIKTMVSATENNPVKKSMGDYVLYINNPKLSELIKPKYTEDNFDKLFNTLNKHGVFGIQTHPVLGTPKTSGISPGEDFEMGARYWITDSVHNIELMKDKEPDAVPKALKTIARFYKENDDSIQKFIDQPIQEHQNDPNHPINMIKAGKLKEAKLLGVPHIFIPEENKNSRDGIDLKLDEDFNRWRQESHGNALKSLVTGIKEGLTEGKPYGLKGKDINKDVIDTIGNLVSYFKAIDYPNAPSSGNWEEKPFPQR